ncbi:hypothetical protein EBZ39_17380, partial [bacterium]|nr:hypothetical protein [bacterium]
QERARIQELMRDPALFQTPEGRMDIERLNQLVPRIAPLTGPALVQQLTTLDTNQTAAAQAAQNLTQDQRTMIASRLAIMGRLGVKDPRAYMAELDQLRAENPNNPQLHRLTEAYKNTLKVLPPGADLPSLAISGANSLLSPQTQQQAFAPQIGTIGTGAATFQTTTRPSIAGEVPTVQVAQQPMVTAQLPPSAREVPTGQVDVENRPIVNVFDANGRFVGQRVVTETPTAGQLPGATLPPPMQPPMMQPGMQQGVQVGVVRPPDVQRPGQETTPVARMRPGETQATYQAADQIRMNAANAAQTVSDQTFNNNEIIKLADDVILGRGAQFIGALSGNYAVVPFTTDNATNLNKIGHFMALQTARLAQSSGLAGTDAARNIAGEVAGTTNWTAPAVKHTARINRSLATATDLFNQGVQNAFNRTKDPISARDFQNQWSQTVDMNAVRLFDAMRNNDKEAIREVVTAAGGPNSPGYKRLVTNI